MVRNIVFGIVFVPVLFAQTPVVSCANGANTAQEGQPITCTSSTSVAWSLSAGSVGALSNQTGTSVIYTAPASVISQNVVYGVQTNPDDAVWNTPIDNLPVNAESSNWISEFNGGTNVAVVWGYSKADGSTPTESLKQYYGSNIVNNNFVVPSPPYLKRENGAYRSWADNNDHHQIAVRITDGTFWEVYNRLIPGNDPTSITCQDNSSGCNAISAITYPWSNYGIVGGTDAAGLPLAPLTIRPSDVYNGLTHATRFSTGVYIIRNDANVWPAVGLDYNGPVGAQYMPYGMRLRLRVCNGSSVITNCVTLSSYSTYAQNILAGWQHYGLMLADAQNGNSITFSASAECQADPNIMAALIAVGGIPPSDFDAVDESSLEYAAGSIEACPYNTTCVSGTENTYEQPLHQAIVTATPTASGSAVSNSIALEGVAIGLTYPTIYAVAANYSFQIPYWVNGTTNASVTWSVQSGVGSVTAGGVYTPPASTSGGTTAILKAVSAADSNAIAYEYVYVLPLGANPAGTLRIDVGGSGETDGNGNVWQPDQDHEVASSYTALGGDYPGWTNAGAAANPAIGVYQSVGYTYGGDLVYTFFVPNGNYKVHMLLGNPYDGAPFWQTTYNPANHSRIDLEAQGQISAHNFNMALAEPAGYTQVYGVPIDAYIPAKVTNNVLQVAQRGVFLYADLILYGSNCSSCMSPLLNGLEMLPDSTAARWAIDTQQTTTISPASTLQLSVVDWYTGLSDAVWSIVNGPGTITSTGLYTAPDTQPSATTSVVIQAQSASHPSVSVSATVYFAGTTFDVK